MKITKPFSAIPLLLACTVMLVAEAIAAHPGSGIAFDADGTLFITDTGKGIWKLKRGGKPELISQTAPHWMALDRKGLHAKERRNFGKWFWRLTAEGESPTVIGGMDYPMAIAPDGTIYYVNTEVPPGKVIRRTLEGKEEVLQDLKTFQTGEAPPGKEVYATAITVSPDGSIYVVEAAAQAENVAIRKIDAAGKISLVASNFVPASLKTQLHEAVDPAIVPKGEPVPTMSRTYCRGLEVAVDGTIYIAANACGAVLALAEGKEPRIVLQAEAPWLPTGVTIFEGEVYALEFDHTGHDRKFWTPRVRKIGADGKIETLLDIRRD